MSDKPTHVIIDRETLECLRDVAETAREDLMTGLADGTYDEDSIAGWTQDGIADAIVTATSVLTCP